MRILSFWIIGIILFACNTGKKADDSYDKYDTILSEQKSTQEKPLKIEGENHLANIQQLTFGGNNAEAYFSFDGEKIVFQSDYKKWGLSCDQIFYHNLNDGSINAKPQLISTGLGRTTCSYFMPGDSTIIYSSTHLKMDSCPAPVMRSKTGKYVWPVYAEYDIFIADLEGNILKQLTEHEGYDAEPTVSPNGDKIVFTSDRSGDLELWTMDLDGSNKKQVTFGLGYDGGAFFSPDGKKLVFRSSRPQSDSAIKEYKELLAKNLVQPTNMEIYTCNIDGSDLKQITNLGKANWAPFFHPSGEKIIFSSNHPYESGYQFNLFMTDLEGKNI